MIDCRTLIRVVSMAGDSCQIVLPAAERKGVPVTLLKKDVPLDIWDLLEPGKRLHARVNADNLFSEKSALAFHAWESE